MKENVKIMEKYFNNMKTDENVVKLYKYYNNQKYLFLLLKQYNGLITNMKSIELLVENQAIEDGFTIFRKYLETFFVIMSILENPYLVDKYIEHDKYIGKKSCNIDMDEVHNFRINKPPGFLEFGYIEELVIINENFRYSMRRVSEVGKADHFFHLYSLCNNFVHNNLSSVSLEIEDGITVIVDSSKETVRYMIKKFDELIFNK